MDDVLASVARLRTLAHMGSVTFDADELNGDADETTAAGVQLLRQRMLSSNVQKIVISREISEAEFLKLARLLNSPPSTVAGGIIDAMAALSITNVQLFTGDGIASEELDNETMSGSEETDFANTEFREFRQHEALSEEECESEERMSDWLEGAEHRLAVTVANADGAAVATLLSQISNPEQFQELASTLALQLVVDEVVAERLPTDAAAAIIRRAGAVGAEAVYRQLVAEADPRNRNKLFSLAVSLPAIVEVASAHLHDSGWYRIRAAAALLGEVHETNAVHDLTRLLRHDDPRVRLAAVIALGHIGGSVVRARLESVCFDSVEAVRNGALSVVFASSGGDELPPNELVTNNEADELDTALAVVTALAEVRTPRARERLTALARSTGTGLDSLQIRLAAIGVLGEAHMPEARSVLEQLTGDSHHLIRERAQAALQ